MLKQWGGKDYFTSENISYSIDGLSKEHGEMLEIA